MLCFLVVKKCHTLPFRSSCCFTGCESLFSSLDPHPFIPSASQLNPTRSELPPVNSGALIAPPALLTDWRGFFFLIFCENFDVFLYQNSPLLSFLFFNFFSFQLHLSVLNAPVRPAKPSDSAAIGAAEPRGSDGNN